MSMAHLLSVLFFLFFCFFLAISFFGLGKKIFLSLGLRENAEEETHPTLFIWIGWACSLVIFLLLHLFVPLNFYTVFPVFLTGCFFAIPDLLRVRPRLFSTWPCILLTLVFFVIVFWIASRAMLAPTNYDSGLYHFNKIRWINSFAVIPGLGNLHGRLAFNQSFFNYAAVLNFFPYFNKGYALANSFLFLLLAATCFDFFRPVIKKPILLMESSPFRYISILLLLPALLQVALFDNANIDGLSSPTPDFAALLLQVLMMLLLFRIIEHNTNQKNTRLSVCLALLAAVSVTVKLSNLAFAAFIFVFAFSDIYLRSDKKTAFLVLAVNIFMVLLWCSHSVILSGAPLFPSTIARMEFEWSIPVERMVDEANWVYSWARQPSTHWSNVLGNWAWLKPWLFRSSIIIYVFYPLAVSCFFLLVYILLRCKKKAGYVRLKKYYALLVPSISIIYWFFTAPDARFAHAFFILTPLAAMLLLLESLRNTVNFKRALYSVSLFFSLYQASFGISLILYRGQIPSISYTSWQEIPQSRMREASTSSGLIVFLPEEGDQCWDSPLPSSPYYNRNLRLRNPENMGAGFTVLEKEF